MERKYRKAINFDLSVHELEKYYPDYRKAYYDVKRFFKKWGFEHRQGSRETKTTGKCKRDSIKFNITTINHQTRKGV